MKLCTSLLRYADSDTEIEHTSFWSAIYTKVPTFGGEFTQSTQSSDYREDLGLGEAIIFFCSVKSTQWVLCVNYPPKSGYFGIYLKK